MTATSTLSLDGVPFIIRPLSDDDRGYVASTWKREHRHLSGVNVPYDKGQSRLIDNLFRSSATAVACDPELPSTIIGWACGRAGLLHYAFVRRGFRSKGIGRELMKVVLGGYESKIEVTHKFSFPFKEATHRFVYNPYPLMVTSEN